MKKNTIFPSSTHREGVKEQPNHAYSETSSRRQNFFLATWKGLLARGAPKFKSVAQLNLDATAILQIR